MAKAEPAAQPAGTLKAAPKKGRLLAAYAESKVSKTCSSYVVEPYVTLAERIFTVQELTTAINKRNEKNAIGQAANAGGHLKTVGSHAELSCFLVNFPINAVFLSDLHMPERECIC